MILSITGGSFSIQGNFALWSWSRKVAFVAFANEVLVCFERLLFSARHRVVFSLLVKRQPDKRSIFITTRACDPCEAYILASRHRMVVAHMFIVGPQRQCAGDATCAQCEFF